MDLDKISLWKLIHTCGDIIVVIDLRLLHTSCSMDFEFMIVAQPPINIFCSKQSQRPHCKIDS